MRRKGRGTVPARGRDAERKTVRGTGGREDSPGRQDGVPKALSGRFDGQDTEGDLPAGGFSAWLRTVRIALRSDRGMDVDCGDCTACCTSSYFVHVRPDEACTLRRIPKELLAPAPGHPPGHMLVGHDDEGICPLFSGRGCSIYADRPQTCRAYDCRIFAAAGTAAEGEDKSRINAQVQRWKFSYPSRQDLEEHRAVQAAARFILEHAASFPGGRVPSDRGQLAVVALKTFRVFLDGPGAAAERASSDQGAAKAIAEAIVEASRSFDAGSD